MKKYYVIIVNDDNTIYRVFGFDTAKDAHSLAFDFAKKQFVVCIVNKNCLKISDNAIVKKARKYLKEV